MKSEPQAPLGRRAATLIPLPQVALRSHSLLALGVTVAVACGFDGSGSRDPALDPSVLGEGGAGLDEGGAGDAGALADGTTDALFLLDGAIVTVTPSHVGAVVDPTAPDLSGVVVIDTSTLTLKLPSGSLPPGLRFEAVDGKAVLFVGRWSIDANVVVLGSAPLVVLAAREVIVSATLDASARGLEPGPGASGGGMGPGRGYAGTPSGSDDPGGGGAGFGTAGARGGNGSGVTGGAPGVTYGSALTDLLGGSGGGNGTPFNVSPCTNKEGAGGAGGGALQITSALSITVTVNGAIACGGGGGRGGCINGSDSTMSGGGGGSGGTIFLEAPSIKVDGALAANGGGGGGGAQVSTAIAGQAGEDAKVSLSAALGGPGSTDRRGGNGGTRDALPQQPPGNNNNAGGGGGAYGRIWLRTRAVPATVTGTITTPTPALDATL